METIFRKVRAAKNHGADFTPFKTPSRPLVIKKDLLKAMIPLAFLVTSCVPQASKAPISTEMPKPVNATNTIESKSTISSPADLLISPEVKTIIGEQEYGEIKTGAIKGKDYKTGQESDWTVEATSVKAKNYNDSNFSYVVTGEATDKSGKRFTVIWNEEKNYWFKSEKINTDLLSENRTNFGKQLQGIVENRDMYRLLLTQIDTTFPENTETPRFWMVPRAATHNNFHEIFYTLDMSRADYNGEPDGSFKIDVGQETYGDVHNGTFTKGNEPYRYSTMIDGMATNLKNSRGEPIEDREFSVIPMLVQNTDGKTFIVFGGLDAVQRDDIMFGPNSVDAQGNTGIQRKLIDQKNRMALVIPPANAEYWNNYDKNEGNNGGIHYRGWVNFENDAIIAIQDKPGVFDKLLDQIMQERLDAAVQDIVDNNYGANTAVPFDTNGLPQNVINYLSSHILETYYNSYGSK